MCCLLEGHWRKSQDPEPDPGPLSDVRIRGSESGSIPKCHGSAALIYREPGFLAIVWIGYSPTLHLPPSRQQLVSFNLPVCLRSSLLTGGGWRGGGGASSYYGLKAWSSINHSILYASTSLAMMQRWHHGDFYFQVQVESPLHVTQDREHDEL